MLDAIVELILNSLSNKHVAVVATLVAALAIVAYLFFNSNWL